MRGFHRRCDHHGPWRRGALASLGLVLLTAAWPAHAWLLQARIDPLQETRIAQGRHLADTYETAFRRHFAQARRETPVATACRQAADRAAAIARDTGAWRLELVPAERHGEEADTASQTRFRWHTPIDGLPEPCRGESAMGERVLLITLGEPKR